MKNKILFVCLGNICRSPAADGVMRKLVGQQGMDNFVIDSAGIGSWHVGDLPDHRMRQCGQKRGYTFDHHARQVRSTDFQDFDLIAGMDEMNIRDLKDLAPDADALEKIVCLANFMTEHKGQKTIPDPYYGDEKDFEFALDLIEDACQGLLKWLTKNNK